VKRLSRLIALMLIVALLVLIPALSSTGVPAEFRAATEPEVARAQGDHSWMVFYSKGSVGALPRVEWVKKKRAATDGWKPGADWMQIRMEASSWYWQRGTGLPARDGWIVAASFGEWGGGLYWLSKDGSDVVRISDRNTDEVMKTNGGIFAVQSLHHLTFWYSDLIEVRKTATGWTTELVTNLHEAPRFVLPDKDRFILVMSDYVCSLEPNGRRRELYRLPVEERVESAILLNDGSLWIGSCRGLLRLQPKTRNEYVAQWFLPVDTADVRRKTATATWASP
jgi:hypothetical protein